MRKKIVILFLVTFSLAFLTIFCIHRSNPTKPLQSYAPQLPKQQVEISSQPSQQNTAASSKIEYIGPRGNVPKDAPADYGFWSFAIADPGKISRSGQPTLKDFQWLKNNGWKSVVDLRINGDHGEQADDAIIPGFNDLGFNYLHLQIIDGAAPTNDQAEQFLKFASDPNNQPVHVHCRGGIGRAGTMIALYRYSIQSWPIDKAIEESKLFSGGVSKAQQEWLNTWAQNHKPGDITK